MKNAKEMMSLLSLVTGVDRNRTLSITSTHGTLCLAFLSLLVVSSALPGHAQSVSSRDLPWASDGNYRSVEIQSSCQANDEKHAVWQTDVRNTADSPIQLKATGKTTQIDPNTSVQIDPIAVKNCKKPLRLKLDARAVGDRDHYALDYNDGVVKAHHKSPTDWMGMTTAIMAGVSAGMGNPVPMPDPPAADQGDGGDNQ
jgi:hypothetical protein